MKKILKKITPLLLLLLFLASCASESNDSTNESSTENELNVVTSIFPVYEITKEIAGDEADVSLMVGANEDAHHYEPSAQAVASVNEADIFIYSSDVMEFWVESLLEVVENESLQVVKLAEGLDLEIHEDEHQSHEDHDHDYGHAHDHGGLDPHFWLNPAAVSEQVPLITTAFITKDSENEEAYLENEAVFQQKLLEIDQSYQEAFADAEQRSFVVQHEAFGHLANRYHLNQIAVGGLTTEVEPSPKQLVDVVEFVEQQQVPVIYYQSGENSAIAETVAEETETEIAVLYDLENAPTSLEQEDSLYLEALAHNLEQLKLSID